MGRLQVNGARGVTLLGFSLMSLVFGVAFNSPVAVIPPPPPGLSGLNDIIPLWMWAFVWYASAVSLLVGAFRQDQSRSMMLFAGLLAVWCISYGTAAFTTYGNPRLTTVFVLQTVIFGGLLVSCLGVARLLNAPPVDLEALRKRVDVEGETENNGG